MILAPAFPVDSAAVGTPIAVRLIGVLDRVLVDAFNDSCAGLLAAGRRTLILSLNDSLGMRDESLRRFVATLEAYRAAGHTVLVERNASWARLFRHCGSQYRAPSSEDAAGMRRHVIVARSLDRRSGAA